MSEPWFPFVKSESRPRLRLFCLPFGGGAASVFRQWPAGMPSWVEVRAVQMPGRETRLGEPPITSVDEFVERFLPDLEPLLDLPCVFFGHSIGAIQAFDVVRGMRRAEMPLPLRLIVSGAGAVNLPPLFKPIYHLPDEEFCRELARLNGTPPQVLENEELMRFFLPILRADFQVRDTFRYRPEEPLPIPIRGLGGTMDTEVGPTGIKAWKELTSADFQLAMVRGDHFFLQTAQAEVVRKVRDWIPSPDGGAGAR